MPEHPLFVITTDGMENASRRFGIDKTRAVTYHADREGTRLNYEVLSEAVCSVRESRPLAATWKDRIRADFQKRK